VEEDSIMPLRDHFRPPLDDQRHWEGFHGQWPAMMVLELLGKLPSRYFAEPRVHSGGSAEIDVATFHEEDDAPLGNGEGARGGLATAVWAPARPTLTLATDFPADDEYEIRVFDRKRKCRLVAAVEIVSPANKDRPEKRGAFVAKCVALLREHVSVVVIDVVTIRNFNLYQELLQLLGQSDPALGGVPPPLYAVACRTTPQGGSWQLETWYQAGTLGQPLPTLPLWLTDDFAVPLELDSSYETTCRVLRIP
jgi:hypothetical protein